MPLTYDVVLSICRVYVTAVYFVRVYLLPMSLSNPSYHITPSLSSASTHHPFPFVFYFPVYFSAVASYHTMSSYRASAAAIYIIPHLHRPLPWISSRSLDFSISLTHHHFNSYVILSIFWIYLLWYAPLFLFCAACSTLLFLFCYALHKLIHYYCWSFIIYTLIWLLYYVPPHISPLALTLLHYHMICSFPSDLYATLC